MKAYRSFGSNGNYEGMVTHVAAGLDEGQHEINNVPVVISYHYDAVRGDEFGIIEYDSADHNKLFNLEEK